MSAWWITAQLAVGGLLGIAVGVLVVFVVDRLSAGIPMLHPSRCEMCDERRSPSRRLPAIASRASACGTCSTARSVPSARNRLIILATGLSFVGVIAYFLEIAPASGAVTSSAALSAAITVVAHLYLVAISIALMLLDLDTHRLPNTIVLPSYPVLGALFVVAGVLGDDGAAILRSVAGAGILWLFYAVLRLSRPVGMGGGDVKLAGLLGLALGWAGWGPLVVGAFAAFLLGGVFGVALLLTGRADRTTKLAFGPWMIIGAWVGITLGRTIADAYGALFGS